MANSLVCGDMRVGRGSVEWPPDLKANVEITRSSGARGRRYGRPVFVNRIANPEVSRSLLAAL
jgi:hypothetical protein